MKNFHYQLLCFFIVALASCSEDDRQFAILSSKETGITFRNTLKESSDFNIFNYMYFYNGGGVAVGDLNGDDLPDIYFTSNQEANKLYLNQGDLKFIDITDSAGVEGLNGWTTGVTMADVNNDGRLDIYVSYVGDYLIYNGRNQLFINEGVDQNGIPKFSDRAVEFGLDLVGFSTQAAFFDYDRDGDLDMFMLNHSLHQQGTFGKSTLRKSVHALAGDKLLKNDNGHFVDVTAEAGIYSSVIGYGLGIVVSDVNMDGWQDIYIGNDFHENDYLYLNKGDGTFIESLEKSMPHTSRYTMGVDFADFNNDAFPDLITMDMLPEDPLILKASAAEEAYDIYSFKLNYGYNHQFARNTLQLNNKNGTFSDIALLAGVPATDWSWSALFADFDLDGHKDIFVANGIFRRSNDLDYINFMEADSVQARVNGRITEHELSFIDKMPQIKLQNFLYINNRDSTFTDRAGEFGLDKVSYSNGAAYADLDNDGDLDIVTNNLEDEAFVCENRTIKSKGKEKLGRHFLQIKLKGKDGNKFGIGTKVILYDSSSMQLQECMPTRGFQSSVDYKMTFGTSAGKVDSALVIWTDGSYQRLYDLRVDTTLSLDQKAAFGNFDYTAFHHTKALFSEASLEIPYKHKENSFVEFNREQLIPHMFSYEGPASAIGDVNGDGLDDLFLGGAKWQYAQIFVQSVKGNFVAADQPALRADSTYEDVDAVMFDADGDKDLDIVVVSGGNEFSRRSKYQNSRLYLNNGKGKFSRSNQLSDIFLTGSCVAVSDVDKDGDLDMFLGARTIPWKYGIKPDSYLLVNDGKGHFIDATTRLAPALKKFGFVKDAIWTDMDGNGFDDLVIAAEWEPPIIFLNKGSLVPLQLEGSGLEKAKGWWSVIRANDFDKDGDVDLVAGNFGLNSKLRASVEEPVKMFVSDFDGNDSIDQVLSHYIKGKEYPFHTRDELTKQMPYLKKKYLSYRKFAQASLTDVFANDELEKAEQFEANHFESSYIENLGNGKFLVRPLPKAAQLSTVNAILIEDFDEDGFEDMVIAGNFYPINIQLGRNDAGYGQLLKGNGKGTFKSIEASELGIKLSGEVRNLLKITVQGMTYYLAVRNNEPVTVFR